MEWDRLKGAALALLEGAECKRENENEAKLLELKLQRKYNPSSRK